MDRTDLYFRLSLIWLAVLLGGFAYLFVSAKLIFEQARTDYDEASRRHQT
jgi:hypothetical protein